ncbi:MAG: DnaJ domain-containing protein [Thermosynechococcaceae cyanobacterium]
MDTAQCYRLLELKATANLADVKSSYRRLARRWHPDINPDSQQAHDMFIKVTQAYEVLQKVIPPTVQVQKKAPVKVATPSPATARVTVTTVRSKPTQPPAPQYQASPADQAVAATPESPPVAPAELSAADQKLKVESYKQLQDLIKRQRLPRAVALVEALANRWPQDLEVRQWKALIYQRWARQLIRERKLNQARAYLKQALKTDPHNKSLWAEVSRDFQMLERVL